MKLRLRELRESRGLSLQQVAIKFGISKSAVSHYEKHSREMRYEMLCKFAKYYGTTIDYILGYDPED